MQGRARRIDETARNRSCTRAPVLGREVTHERHLGPRLLSCSAPVLVRLALVAVVVGVAVPGCGASGKTAPTTSIPAATSTALLASSTTTTEPPTTIAVPEVPKPTAAGAAGALVSAWAAGNRRNALSVATPTAVATLFAVSYPSGLAIDRGCSTAFTPIVCSYGPPGGSSPNDPLFQIYVFPMGSGWHVKAVEIDS